MKETYLRKQVLDALRKAGRPAWPTHDERHYAIVAGLEDVDSIMPDGVFLAVECKSVGEKMSDDQNRRARAVVATHGIFLLVRKVEDLLDFMKRTGIL